MSLFFVGWVVGGFLLGLASIALARRLELEREILSGALVLLGVWYLGFGIYDGRSAAELLPQILGGLFFASCGVLGLRVSPVFAAVGWTLHAGWDFLSPALWDVSYMPSWTAPACLGYDVLLGTHLFRLWRRDADDAIAPASSASA